ncbi:hypothetical protein D3C77_359560 [compost metagenome]
MTPGACRQDAVEHVDAAPDRLDQIDRLADAHQIAGAVLGQELRRVVQDLAHGVVAFADGQAADGVAVEADLLQTFRRFAAQVLIGRALLDAEQGLRVAGAEGVLGALRPAGRKLHALTGALFLGGPGDAFVQLHDDVRAQAVGLDLDRAFGRQDVFRPVDVAREGHGLLGQLGDSRQAHDLKAAGVRQDRLVPAHELMQPAEALHPLRAGTQHQVVGVAQQDVGAGLLDLIHRHRLDRGGGADRHEGGGADVAARGLQHPGAGAAFGGVDLEGEGQQFTPLIPAEARTQALAMPMRLARGSQAYGGPLCHPKNWVPASAGMSG